MNIPCIIRTEFGDWLSERRYGSVKTEKLGTKMSPIGSLIIIMNHYYANLFAKPEGQINSECNIVIL